MKPSTEPVGIALVVSDVDGTLLTPKKAITPQAKAAVALACKRHPFHIGQQPASARVKADRRDTRRPRSLWGA